MSPKGGLANVMCVICLNLFSKADLVPVSAEPGRFWDVCLGCKDDSWWPPEGS